MHRSRLGGERHEGSGGQRQQYWPLVFIVRKKETARLPGDLERRMTAAALATCNPTRELTAKAAASLWRNCFSNITAVIHTDGDEVGAIRRTISCLLKTRLHVLPCLASVEIEGVYTEATKRLVSNCLCMLEGLVAGKKDFIISC